MATPLRFGAGRVLGKSFSIWARNIGKFTILCASVYSPLVAYVAYGILASPPRTVVGFMWFSAVLTLGWCLLWYVAPLSVIHGVLQQLRGEPASLGGCLRVYLTRLFPALGTGLVVGFLAFLSIIPTSFLAGAIASDEATSLVRAPLITILVLSPAALVACVYWVAVPVAASERPGIFASLRRSARLTKGSRASILAIVLVVIALQVVPVLIAGVGLRGYPYRLWIFLLLLTVSSGYGAVATSVAYHDLRVAKEGVGIDVLVRVFA